MEACLKSASIRDAWEPNSDSDTLDVKSKLILLDDHNDSFDNLQIDLPRCSIPIGSTSHA